jgi:hypothetical protein
MDRAEIPSNEQLSGRNFPGCLSMFFVVGSDLGQIGRGSALKQRLIRRLVCLGEVIGITPTGVRLLFLDVLRGIGFMVIFNFHG